MDYTYIIYLSVVVIFSFFHLDAKYLNQNCEGAF